VAVIIFSIKKGPYNPNNWIRLTWRSLGNMPTIVQVHYPNFNLEDNVDFNETRNVMIEITHLKNTPSVGIIGLAFPFLLICIYTIRV